MPRINVAVLGATGMVGQRFVQLLARHPWFELTEITGSERSAGKSYAEAVRWVLDGDPPPAAAALPVLSEDTELQAPLVFSALPAASAGPIEQRLAAAGHVICSNARSHRDDPDVPLLIPEVNPEHLELIAVQRRQRGWSGAIVTNPNCTSTGPVMALKPLHTRFGVTRLLITSMQAVSGAGYPGVASLDALDNVVPYISNEEERVELEPRKLLGTLEGEAIRFAEITISAHCNRVGVIDGHLTTLSVGFENPPDLDTLRSTLQEWQPLPQQLGLPSAPNPPLLLTQAPDRPQPRRDRDAGNGMAAVIGRIRPCPLLDVRMVVLAHNTLRGAAGGALLNAELLVSQGIVT